MALDGKSFWLVWTDYQEKLPKEEAERLSKEVELLRGPEKVQAQARLSRLEQPYYSFNIQRVDLVVW